VKRGGDKKRVVLVSLFLDIPTKKYKNLRKKLNIGDKFVYGLHQRNSDGIFSPIPLNAYKAIEDDNTMFMLMNGSNLYKKQAHELDIRNIIFLPAAKVQEEIYEFLSTLDVYAHGRKDGEVNSAAIAEAMYFNLPVVSHFSEMNNGHVECIGQAGRVLRTIDDYAKELQKLRTGKSYYKYRSQEAKKRFMEKYELRGQIKNVENIYEDVLRNPFPHKFKRRYLHWKDFLIKRFIVNKYTYTTLRKLQRNIKRFKAKYVG
jgi:glycosyltransferase involved in cell wall biosynthesis